MAVERAGVVDAEVLEEHPGLEVLAQRRHGGVDALLQLVGHRHALDELLEAGLLAAVLRVDAHPRHRLGELRHGGGVARPLSLRMMIALRPEWPRLFNPSKAMPPVIEPSPMMATTRRSAPAATPRSSAGSPPISSAVAMPWA